MGRRRDQRSRSEHAAGHGRSDWRDRTRGAGTAGHGRQGGHGAAAEQSDPHGTAAAGIKLQDVSPPLTGEMVSQEWNRINRPEMTGGDVAKAIISSPLTVPIGIIEELRGLFGGDTVEGWAQQASDRYSNPNFNESRAFGVKGVAKTPEFGDRFLGVVKGTAQAGATRGILMRNEIGRYNKQRAAEIQTFKDVGDIYQQSQSLRKGEFQLQTQEEEFNARMAARRAATRASGASANRSEYNLQKKREDAATVAQLAEAIAADPSLADGQHNSALMSLAKGNLNLVKQALEVTATGRTMPDVTGVPPATRYTTEAGQAGDIAKTYSDVAGTEDQRAYAASLLEAENARKDAEEQRKSAEAERVRAGTL